MSMSRSQLRAALLEARAILARSDEAPAAARSMLRHLAELLEALEPDLLGLYWAVRSEFNLEPIVQRMKAPGRPRLALPYAQSVAQSIEGSGGNGMDYRLWNGAEPVVKDACGIPSSDGAMVVPDVVIVPCVGFTRSGYRLGYGGGYFDRWLAKHRHVTAVGIAWSKAEVDEADFAAQAHDIPLSVIVTEQGVV